MGEGWRDSQGPRRALILLGHGPDFSLFSLSLDDYFLLSSSASTSVPCFPLSPTLALITSPLSSRFFLALALFLPSFLASRSSPNPFEGNAARLPAEGLRFRAARVSLFSTLVSELSTRSNNALGFQQNIPQAEDYMLISENFAS